MNKGFTLIELLAVIIILSIIATITLFTVGNILKDSKDSLSKTQKEKLYEAAKIYYLEHANADYVCVKTLIDEDYIEQEKVFDPKDRKEMNGYIVITVDGNKTKYTYDNTDTSKCPNE